MKTKINLVHIDNHFYIIEMNRLITKDQLQKLNDSKQVEIENIFNMNYILNNQIKTNTTYEIQ